MEDGLNNTAKEPEAKFKDLDAAVVGGGPAGLAVALALRTVQPHLNIKVFEASQSYTLQGAGVSIALNGLRALEAISPLVTHQIISSGNFLCATYQYSDETGERMPWVYGMDPRKAAETGFPGCLVPWNVLRTSLYDHLPKDMVEFGCKVVDCSEQHPAAAVGDESSGAASLSSELMAQEENGGESAAGGGKRYLITIARTAPGEAAAGPEGGAVASQRVVATARYVIAADGYFSRVRRTAGDGRTPAFRERVRWLGSFTQADLDTVPLPAGLADKQTALGGHAWLPVAPDRPLQGPPDRGLMVYTAGAGRDGSPQLLVWTVWTTVQALDAAGEAFPLTTAADGGGAGGQGRAEEKHGEETEAVSVHDNGGSSSSSTARKQGARALQRALAAAAHMPPDVRAMLAATPPERVLEFGMYMHHEDSYQPGAWARGGLLLLGDAAHAGRPDGQGANLAFEDAAVLGALVRQHGLGPETFAKWEAARLDRARDILHDATPSAAARTSRILSSSFEPLWCPVALSGPGGPLPEEVAAEVREALATSGGVDKGREAVLAWSRAELQRIAEDKVADRHIPETVPAPTEYRPR